MISSSKRFLSFCLFNRYGNGEMDLIPKLSVWLMGLGLQIRFETLKYRDTLKLPLGLGFKMYTLVCQKTIAPVSFFSLPNQRLICFVSIFQSLSNYGKSFWLKINMICNHWSSPFSSRCLIIAGRFSRKLIGSVNHWSSQKMKCLITCLFLKSCLMYQLYGHRQHQVDLSIAHSFPISHLRSTQPICLPGSHGFAQIYQFLSFFNLYTNTFYILFRHRLRLDIRFDHVSWSFFLVWSVFFLKRFSSFSTDNDKNY